MLGEDEGPGPFANLSYVNHLCSCLEESKKVCEWLSKEDDAFKIFGRLNGGASFDQLQDSFATASTSNDYIQSFLVKGATFLQRILLLSPNKIEAVSNQQKTRIGRKRRRANTNEMSEQQKNDDDLLPGSVSVESLDKAMHIILNDSSEENQQMLMASTLKLIVSVLYLELWHPFQDWIQK